MADGGNSQESTKTEIESTSAPTNNIPPTDNTAEGEERPTENDDQTKSISCADANNNDTNATSARETTTVDNNLTATNSETGPLMKVVVSPERGPIELLDGTQGATIIYTDASRIRDGTAGIGIFFGKDHPLNTSEKLPGKHQSVAWAEIIAATAALQKIRAWPKYNNGPVILRTDYLLIVEAMQINEITEFSHPQFYVELQALKKIAQDFPKGVQFEHVYAHNGEEGNEEADALATKATSKYNLPSPRRARSKPPSRRMSRRTRSAYIKRSAPPEVHGEEKHKKSNASKKVNAPFVRPGSTKSNRSKRRTKSKRNRRSRR